MTTGARWKSFGRDAGGISAVEFSMVLPIMLIVSFASLEFAWAVRNSHKLAILSRTVADLTSQDATKVPITTSAMNDIVASARLVLTPYPSAGAKIVVSALGVDPDKYGSNPKVCSSFATGNATKRAEQQVAATLKVSDGFQVKGMRYILSEVSMSYTPLLGSSLLTLIGFPKDGLQFQSSTSWPTRGGKTYNENPYSEIILPSGKEC